MCEGGSTHLAALLPCRHSLEIEIAPALPPPPVLPGRAGSPLPPRRSARRRQPTPRCRWAWMNSQVNLVVGGAAQVAGMAMGWRGGRQRQPTLCCTRGLVGGPAGSRAGIRLEVASADAADAGGAYVKCWTSFCCTAACCSVLSMLLCPGGCVQPPLPHLAPAPLCCSRCFT